MGSTAITILTGLIVTVCYIVACALWPFKRCGKCGGNGKRHSPTARYFGNCRRCNGTGRRLRAGRAAWTYIRHQHNRTK